MIAVEEAHLDRLFAAEPTINDQMKTLAETWARNEDEGPPWTLIAGMLRLGYGAGYSTGLQDRIDAEPPAPS